jgi:hypothetical protein
VTCRLWIQPTLTGNGIRPAQTVKALKVLMGITFLMSVMPPRDFQFLTFAPAFVAIMDGLSNLSLADEWKHPT